MTDYNGYDPIPEPFFVSKPWQQRGGHEEHLTDIKNCNIDRRIMRVVLADFIKEKHLKIPYFYKSYADDVYQVIEDEIYFLPPLKDCSGKGWLELII